MSQNFYQSGESGQVAMIGWDRPMQSAYLTLGDLTANAEEWVEPLILDVMVPFDRVNNLHNVNELVTHFKHKLEIVGVSVPDSLFLSMVDDIKDNTINITRLHCLDKAPVVVDESPFTDGTFS